MPGIQRQSGSPSAGRYSTGVREGERRGTGRGFLSEQKIRERKEEKSERSKDKKKEKMMNIIPVMKSVRRNAELTSFTFYTSAAAHIINIMEWSYSSSLRQHMGER